MQPSFSPMGWGIDGLMGYFNGSKRWLYPLLDKEGNFPCKIHPDSDEHQSAQCLSLDGSLLPFPHCKAEISAVLPRGTAVVISNWS